MTTNQRRRARWATLALVLVLLGGVPSSGKANPHPDSSAAAPARSPLPLRLQASAETHAILELDIPTFELQEVQLDGKPYVALSVPGLEDAAAPGQPRLPLVGALLGLPPSGGVSVRVLDVERRVLSLPQPLAPGAVYTTVPLPSDPETPVLEAQWAPDPALYMSDDLWPAAWIEVGEPFLLRDLRVIRLALHPFRYYPARQEIEHATRLRIQVRFDEPAARRPTSPGIWDTILAQEVLNYDIARGWRGVRPALDLPATNPLAGLPLAFKVLVDADALYQITYGDLLLAGFPLDTVNPTNLRLVVQGKEVAIRVDVGADGRFDPGDRILFYGHAARGRFTRTNVYWLYEDSSPGLRMGSRSVAPTDQYPSPPARWITSHFEENHLYDGIHPEPSGDHWYWEDLSFLQTDCYRGAVWTYVFELPDLYTVWHQPTLRISLQGWTPGLHHLVVAINGSKTGEVKWLDEDRVDSELLVPHGLLREGSNTIELSNGSCPPPPPPPPFPNKMVLNYFSLKHLANFRAIDDWIEFLGESGSRQYKLEGFSTPSLVLFDVTDPTRPVALTEARIQADGSLTFQDQASSPRRYLAVARNAIRSPLRVYRDTPSSLASAFAGAHYLVISYGPFLPAVQPLVIRRASQGLMMMSVDVEDVYDEFSYGLLDPGALKSFLAFVAAHWDPVPDYVLLVGDGTIDFFDYLGRGWRNFIPAYPAYVDLRLVSQRAVEAASDNELDPGTDLPLFMMGRLPADSATEVQAVVQKILSYESGPVPGSWAQRLLFVSDDDDASGAFTAYSDEVYHSISEPFVADRIYLAREPQEPHEYSALNASGWEQARQAVKNAFVGGRLAVTYMGHSSFSQWAQEILLHRDQAPTLQNQGRLPIVLAMTCYTSAFHHPRIDPLDERLVLEPSGGAIATWGFTGAGIATAHRHLALGFLDLSLGEEQQVTLGAASFAGLLRLYVQAPTNRDLIDTNVLFGDPSMPVYRQTEIFYSGYLPLVLSR
jgi:hypothetical protein